VVRGARVRGYCYEKNKNIVFCYRDASESYDSEQARRVKCSTSSEFLGSIISFKKKVKMV